MLQPDMGTTIVMAILTGTVLFVGGLRMRHLVTLGVCGVSAGAVLAVVEPYRRARLLSFIDPFSAVHAQAGGYQVAQSLIALGSGGWTGVGLGAGRAKWLFLPNAHTDFIFAVIGEELGLVGCALVVFLFGALTVFGVRTALRAPDRFGTLLAAGITGWVVGQALVNIGAVTGLLPVTGVPLPFVSFGGSALLFTMAAAGVLLNVARQGR
jgi:cell division protein FtsW